MRKLLIANRGEIAVRIARTARRLAIDTVAVYSDADRGAVHTRVCDQAVGLGGDAAAESYLVIEKLVRAAEHSGADAVHPGYGFLSENADFAAAVADAGLCWVGPPADVIAAMGDKIAAKRIMGDAGLPVLAGFEVAAGVEPDAPALDYPVLVKAAAGGGGKGMRFVSDPHDLADAVASCQREAAAAFGDDRVFVERFMPDPRHVEVQIFGDSSGNVIHFFERECSIQRRHQKIVEESPSPTTGPDLREELCQAAVAAGKALGYQNAGTVEFVVGADGDFAFLEVNTRLQVEHCVTEMTTGLDLVELQLVVADGGVLPLRQEDVRRTGHAIEVRLYAEDPGNDYLPAPGRIHHIRPWSNPPGLRWDSGVASGSAVPRFYDPLLAKIIGHGPTRDDARRVLGQALRRTHLHGVLTNRDLLAAILDDEAFARSDVGTGYLDRRFPGNADRSFAPSAEARRTAAVVTALAGESAWSRRNRIPSGWQNNRSSDTTVRLTSPSGDVEVSYRGRRDATFAVMVSGEEEVVVRRGDVEIPGSVEFEVDGTTFAAEVSARETAEGTEWEVTTPWGHATLVEQPRFPRRAPVEIPGATRAPMPGAVALLTVEAGQPVKAGDTLCVIEAMKMEQRIVAPHDGVVGAVCVAVGDQVEADQVLMVVDGGG